MGGVGCVGQLNLRQLSYAWGAGPDSGARTRGHCLHCGAVSSGGHWIPKAQRMACVVHTCQPEDPTFGVCFDAYIKQNGNATVWRRDGNLCRTDGDRLVRPRLSDNRTKILPVDANCTITDYVFQSESPKTYVQLQSCAETSVGSRCTGALPMDPLYRDCDPRPLSTHFEGQLSEETRPYFQSESPNTYVQLQSYADTCTLLATSSHDTSSPFLPRLFALATQVSPLRVIAHTPNTAQKGIFERLDQNSVHTKCLHITFT